MQLKVIFTVLAALVPLGLATSVSTNCKANEFKQVNFAVSGLAHSNIAQVVGQELLFA
jgi:hypothetical protein